MPTSISKVSPAYLSSVKPAVKTFLSMPKSPLEIVRGAVSAVVISYAMIKSPALWQAANEFSKGRNYAAAPLEVQDKSPPRNEIPQEIKTFLWGDNGLNQKNVIQHTGNCQIMANIISSTFTEEGLRRLESLIEVTDYKLDKKDFYINFNVNINGKKLPVLYKDLTTNNGYFDRKEPQAPHVIAMAIEKELAKNYTSNPGNFTSLSTATFLTNQNHSTLILPAMSDASLVEVLEQAPGRIITVGSYPGSGFEKTLAGIVSIGDGDSSQSTNNKIVLSHEYAVKNCRYENGQYLVTITAYNTAKDRNEEITLTIDELRNNILTITAPTESFNLFDSKTAGIYLFSLLTIMAMSKLLATQMRIKIPK